MWTKITIDGYEITMKHFDEPSEFGIKNGRISKLFMKKDGKCKLNYDRGWDVRPTDPDTKAVLKKVLKQYN